MWLRTEGYRQETFFCIKHIAKNDYLGCCTIVYAVQPTGVPGGRQLEDLHVGAHHPCQQQHSYQGKQVLKKKVKNVGHIFLHDPRIKFRERILKTIKQLNN